MKITATTNFSDVQAKIDVLGRQATFVMAKTLTHVALKIKEEERKQMLVAFDRPTPYTLNSLFVRGATKQRLQSEVWLKGEGSKDDAQGRHYLLPSITGAGGRRLKRFEQRLVSLGYMQSGERAVPAAGATLDAYGNMSRGQIVKVLSQLRTAVVSGDYSNASNSKRSRAKRVQEAYFVSRGAGSWTGGGAWKNGRKSQHLARGVYVRRSFGALGTSIKPVLLFVGSTNYRKRYDFEAIGVQVLDRDFSSVFDASMRDALMSAGPSNVSRLV